MKILKIFLLQFFLVTGNLLGQINPAITSSNGSFTLTCANTSLTLTATSSFTGNVTYTWTTPQMSIVTANSVNASSPGTFTLSASSGTILETSTVGISINTVQPSVTLTLSSSAITCSTPTILMTAISNPTNVSYAWIEPGVGFGCTTFTCIAAQAGTFSVTVKDVVNGCQKTASITVADNRIYPIFNSIGLYTVACPTGTVSLEPSLSSGTANITFQWKTPPGAVTSSTNNLNLVTNAPGDYTLIATNTANGCASSTLVSVYACVGIYELNSKLPVSGYPNPVSDVFHLKSGIDLDFTIEIFDGLGQRLALLPKAPLLDFTHESPGVYLVVVTSSEGRKMFRVVKQ